jgi:ABC-type antimicrobial peptide transport system permease subunit
VKQYALDADARISFYRPHTQQPARSLYVTIRAAGDPAALAGQVREAVREVDPDLPVFRMQTMRARVDESLARRRFLMTLVSLFAVVASALSALGVYSVMAYAVSQGTRELGIRMALGASPGRIRGLVLLQGLVLGGAGVACGLAAAFGLTRLIESLLFGVAATDGLTFTAIAAALALVALVASYLPARRAARIDPVVSLRGE